MPKRLFLLAAGSLLALFIAAHWLATVVVFLVLDLPIRDPRVFVIQSLVLEAALFALIVLKIARSRGSDA